MCSGFFFCEKGWPRLPVAACDVVVVAKVLNLRSADTSGSADVLCSVVLRGKVPS